MSNLSSYSQALQQLLNSYASDQGRDELFNQDGQPDVRWQPVLQVLEELGLDGLAERHEEVQQLLHENGVTFNVHEDDLGQLRSWELDPLPYVIAGHDWDLLEAGLIQRSRLLQALVDDLYGERQVIHEGLLPPELVYTHPSWLFAAADGNQRPEKPRIIFQGMDVYRDLQGQWRLQGDWTQAPSGAGYALENRILLSRTLSNLYREAPLRRLASFLQAQHRCLASLASDHRGEPNLVLLTPGPGSPGYFEHAWLANYMNFSLVEGDDLVVRDGQVSMRTLGGLKRVDVLVRQVTDPWCDPLELSSDSLLGVPGLMQAARRGEVEIANALGVGVLEHPALSLFLPKLCQRLLGEELLLAGPELRWCGEEDHLIEVLNNLEAWQLYPIHQPGQLLDPKQLSLDEQQALTTEIRQSPWLFTARKPAQASTAPSFDARNQVLYPASINLRFFCLTDPEDRQSRVMPGGLAWVGEPGTPVMQSQTVKDIWVLAPVPQPHVSLLRQAQGPILVTRDGRDLPSRVADSLFWMGRYGERLDTKARLLRETLGQLLDDGQLPLETTLLPDLFTALKLPLPPEQPPLAAARQFIQLREWLMTLFTDQAVDNLPWLFSQFLRNSRAVRDHLGDDAWRVINNLRQKFNGLNGNLGVNSARRHLEDLLVQQAAFFGFCNETMPHHYGWRFMDLGRFIERLLSSLELLKLALVTARQPGIPLWEVVLATTDNLTVYRRRYRSQLHPSAILDLLLFDESNPRSVGFMLKRLHQQLEELPRQEGSPFRSQEHRLVIEASSHLHLVDLDSLLDIENSQAAREALQAFLDALLLPLSQLSDALAHSHFSHVEKPRQLVSLQT
ncbi:Uncharacterized conserved protein, circularly permuted ATPgrasp superfamily [Marinospirillum celere]|uniref:Uncharacterized conserved protein, circularly permuted ATPgrasp superfamily n=1 Tax=Marinospirillum celere TaxID=1122252 RepID=A0A1I1E2B1_9GAMM|nr:circularly permuted type 2 ATP-grasp protein [Marinospirillum celere]SFB78993.1 Uncharacterized conserved protein, circularly permuted ATPgrasp superfamily [Marinospirillum celere]